MRYAVKIIYPPYNGRTFEHLDTYLLRIDTDRGYCSAPAVAQGEDLSLTLFASREDAERAARRFAWDSRLANGTYGWEFVEVDL